MAISRSRVLVSGATGFIGHHLVPALFEAGHAVTTVGTRPFPDPRVASVIADLRDAASVAAAVQPGTDVIIHLGARASGPDSVLDPAGTYQVNVAGTQYLLEAARQRGVRTFLFSSTNAVAGDVGTATLTERVPMRPMTPYAATKAAAEMLLAGYVSSFGMAGAALRFCNVYGPGMAPSHGFISRLLTAARHGTTVEVPGYGTQIRDFVHVDDVIAGIFAAWHAGHAGPLILGSGTPVTVNDVVAAARAITGAEVPVQYVAPRPGEVPAVIADISVARGLGYKPRHDLWADIASLWPEFSETAK